MTIFHPPLGVGLSETCINDTRTKPKGCRMEGGSWGWPGKGVGIGGKRRQLYLKNNFLKNMGKNCKSE